MTEITENPVPISELVDSLTQATKALKWARNALVEKEEENRKLKRVILALTEGVRIDGPDS